jgi:hypothetical protein
LASSLHSTNNSLRSNKYLMCISQILVSRFLGHQGPLPLMSPGGLDPSDTITVTSIMAQPATRASAEATTGTRLHYQPEVAQKRPARAEPRPTPRPSTTSRPTTCRPAALCGAVERAPTEREVEERAIGAMPDEPPPGPARGTAGAELGQEMPPRPIDDVLDRWSGGHVYRIGGEGHGNHVGGGVHENQLEEVPAAYPKQCLGGKPEREETIYGREGHPPSHLVEPPQGKDTPLRGGELQGGDQRGGGWGPGGWGILGPTLNLRESQGPRNLHSTRVGSLGG